MPTLDNTTLRTLLNKREFNKPFKGFEVHESRCIANLDYQPLGEDALTGDLTIEFVGPPSGGLGTYKYKGVPLDVYTDLATSSSQGRYFNLYIKNQYEYERIA